MWIVDQVKLKRCSTYFELILVKRTRLKLIWPLRRTFFNRFFVCFVFIWVFSVQTLKTTIERDHGIPTSKQILIISGGELLDDDAVQVCMKTRETCAGTVCRFSVWHCQMNFAFILGRKSNLSFGQISFRKGAPITNLLNIDECSHRGQCDGRTMVVNAIDLWNNCSTSWLCTSYRWNVFSSFHCVCCLFALDLK